MARTNAHRLTPARTYARTYARTPNTHNAHTQTHARYFTLHAKF